MFRRIAGSCTQRAVLVSSQSACQSIAVRSSTITIRHNSTTASKKVRDAVAADKRYQLIREMLYSKDVPTTPARTVPPPTPKSVASPAATAPNDTQAVQNDAIERAWALLKQKEAVAKVAELRGMYESMRNAMEELERTDRRLFEAAKTGSDQNEVVTFPKRLRVPTETPPLTGWDYEMESATKA